MTALSQVAGTLHARGGQRLAHHVGHHLAVVAAAQRRERLGAAQLVGGAPGTPDLAAEPGDQRPDRRGRQTEGGAGVVLGEPQPVVPGRAVLDRGAGGRERGEVRGRGERLDVGGSVGEGAAQHVDRGAQVTVGQSQRGLIGGDDDAAAPSGGLHPRQRSFEENFPVPSNKRDENMRPAISS